MKGILRPVLILVAVAAVLGLMSLAGRKHAARDHETARPSGPPPSKLAGDVRAPLDRFIACINRRDAAGLQAFLHQPFYTDGQKIEDDQARNDLIEKMCGAKELTLESAKVVTAAEAGLPPAADEVLTPGDTILLVEVREAEKLERRVVVLRKSGDGLKLLAVLKTDN